MEFFSTVAHFYKLKNPLNVFLWIFRLISVTCSVYLVTLAFDNKTGVTIVRYPKREAVIFKVFLFELVCRGDDMATVTNLVNKVISFLKSDRNL